MAAAVEAHWPGPLEGLVVTRYGHGAPTGGSRSSRPAIRCRTTAGTEAARDILAHACRD